MSKRVITLTAAALVAAGIASLSSAATAAPVVNALALKNAAATNIETVRWGRGWGPGFGWGLGAGIVGGAIIGGALAAPYYYGYGPYYRAPYYYGPGPYPAPAPAYGPPPGYGPGYAPAPPPGYGPGYAPAPPPGPGGGDGAAAYCSQKYRTYDPATGTFMGNDGARHPCP
jgi:BA14K-like protein